MSQQYPPPQQPAGGNPFGQQAPFQPAPPAPPAPRTGNVALAVLVGLVAMIVGAAAYGGLMRAFADDEGGYTEIGYVAVGVGALVGFAVGKLGGRNPVLPIVSAVLAVAGVYMGQIFGLCLVASHFFEAQFGADLSWTEFVTHEELNAFDVWSEDSAPMAFLFLAIGGFVGFSSAKKAGG
ncbi:hypothetical protein [Streptomyces sp. KLOTTS4A1]|uniref:hypothetical protein n=1 Tax=Streptomyces sp. KLOTTS4A1 TaxID=3390996 RepID=UPI0039F44F4A